MTSYFAESFAIDVAPPSGHMTAGRAGGKDRLPENGAYRLLSQTKTLYRDIFAMSTGKSEKPGEKINYRPETWFSGGIDSLRRKEDDLRSREKAV